MTTQVSTKSFVGALAACAACLEKDTLHVHPGHLRVARDPGALVLSTMTRTENVKLAFRIPCAPGDSWTAVMDAGGACRLAKALRPLAAGRTSASATIEITRTERLLVLVGGGQHVSIPACEPTIEEPAAAAETLEVVGAMDLAERLSVAMTFSKPAEGRTIARGPFVYLSDSPDGLTVPAVVATDGHRLYVDGDARECQGAKFVFQVPGDDWRPAAKALVSAFGTVRLMRTAAPQPPGEDGRKPPEKWLTRLAFEADDRRVEIAVAEPDTSLPHWAGFVPRETAQPDLSVTCDRSELVRAVKAVSGVSADNGAAVMLRADPKTALLRLVANTDHDGGLAQQEIPADVLLAPTMYLHLSGKYVLDILGAVRTARVRIYQHAAPLDAVRFLEVAGDGTTLRPRAMIVMPIRGHDPVEADAAEPEISEHSTPVTEPAAPPLAAAPTVAA